MKNAIFTAFFFLLAASTVRGGWEEYKRYMHELEADPAMREAWAEHIKQFQDTEDPSSQQTAPCESHKSAEVPDSVHKLRAGDIKVVGAMGDSLTAGNGANAWTPIGCLKEYRGYAFSIGGQGSYPDRTTIPTILRTMNPEVTGFSTGTGNRDSKYSQLNVAYPGNTAENMPEQAKMMVSRMRAHLYIDFQKDWKMVTLFIGGNDLCDVCNEKERFGVENYKKNIQTALDTLHAELPRTIVNVISIFDITPIANMASGVICHGVHYFVCNCAGVEKNHEYIQDMAEKYSQAAAELVESGRYDTRDDFTVVFQPFMKKSDIPRKPNGEPDTSYFAPDCFHFSAKGHNAGARMFWNGLFEPVGQKQDAMHFGDPIKCPRKDTYIATAKNSQ